MKLFNRLVLTAFLLVPVVAVWGQQIRQPKFSYVATDSNTALSLRRVTNHNPSVYLGDTVLSFVVDSLRSDGVATVVTVYETDADSVVGLWQVGSGGHRALWLNSCRASFDDFSFAYRSSTERGVVIHTMSYRYPAVDSAYDGRDTVYLGKEGDCQGEKNLCTLLYYPGQVGWRQQREMESALAIRYGALLHGPYVNRLHDTLWNPLGADSLYSFGVCGIGRDDSLALLQPCSVIRGGILGVEAAGPLSDLDYVMLGCDSGMAMLGEETLTVDTATYTVVDRRWMLRASTGHGTVAVRLAADLTLPPSAVRMLVSSSVGDLLLVPDDSLSFGVVDLADREECHVALLVDPSVLTKASQGRPVDDDGGGFDVTVAPNPTTGPYTLHVGQSDEGVIDVRVVDALGRTVESHTTDGPQTRHIHSGRLSDGIHYVTVSSNGHQKTIKLIVTR